MNIIIATLPSSSHQWLSPLSSSSFSHRCPCQSLPEAFISSLKKKWSSSFLIIITQYVLLSFVFIDVNVFLYLYCSTHTGLAAGELVLPLCPHQQLVFARSYPGKPNHILSFILGICLFQYLIVFHSIWLSFCLVVHQSDCLPNEQSKRNQQCQFNFFSSWYSLDIITLRCYLVQFEKSMLRLFIWCFLKQSSLHCIIPTSKISS